MNASKAREYFSAYREGDLNEGLKKAFEKLLREDAGLKREYDQFESVLNLMETSQQQEIVVPSTLHDQIMAKLDHHEWTEKQHATTSFFGKYRLVLMGALASVAIISGILAVTLPNGNTGVSTAGVVPTIQQSPTAEIRVIDGQLNLVVKNAGSQGVIVRNTRTGQEINSWKLNNKALYSPLTNLNSKASALSVFIGTDRHLIVVLPGTQATTPTNATGSVLDCAELMADAFRNPIVLRVADADRTLSWNLAEATDLSHRAKELASQGLSLSVLDNGLLLLTDAN